MERIEALRRVHEPIRAGLVRAHITLVFGVTSTNPQRLRDIVTKVAADAHPFPISLDRVKSWRDPASGERKVFLMVGEGRDSLISIHQKLYTGLEWIRPRSGSPFEPHITVATAPSADQIERAMDAIPELSLPIFGRIEALELVALETDKLVPLDCIRLGGHSSEQA